MIFLDFLKVKNYENMLQDASNCTIKIFFRGSMPQNPPSKRVASPPPPQIIVAPLGKSCIGLYELLLRNLFENPPWQTVDCV